MKFKPVPRPERTVIVKNNGAQYVYLTQCVKYSSELKASRPQRISIGKLNEEGLLIPNKNYIEIFGEDIEVEIPSQRSDCISFGPQLVVDKIAHKYGLYDLLQNIFEDEADKILDVATYMVMSENNVMQYFNDYGYSHTLFSVNDFSDSTISNLFKKIRVKDIDLFQKSWSQMVSKEKVYIAYDSTNMNTVAGQIELAEFGHAKDDPDLPQINVSLGYNQTEQVPMFYELYPGSIIDNTECGKMVERAIRLGCTNIGFILDRGYFSKKNIDYFEENGFDYMIMTKGNASFIKEAILEYGSVLKNGYSYYMKDHQLYGMTVKKDLFKQGKEQYIHLYYNGIKAEQEKITINERFYRMDEALKLKKDKKIKRKEDVAAYEKYYKIRFDDNGYFLNYNRKDEVIKNLIKTTGYFAIITSEEMDATEALERYRDRDAVEKIFRMEKSYLGNDVFRVHSDESLEGKMFVSFIGLMIRNEIYRSLKGLYKKNRKEYTVPQVIREYERMTLTKLSDDKYHIRYNLTKKQKTVLEALGITEKEYVNFANKVKIPLDKN